MQEAEGMEELVPWDWKRILLGEAPVEFLLEVALRTAVVFLLLLVTVRLLGKRMSGQISIAELAVMITLGAIVSPGMQLPDRAVAYVAVALLVILILHSVLNYFATRYEKVAQISEGKMACLVKDGILQLNEMKKNSISRQELFSQLRQKQIENLASVERVYLEACGKFSIFTSDEIRPGLLVFPQKDEHMLDYKHRLDHGLRACCNCGNVQNIETEAKKCRVCEHEEWMAAYQ